MCAELSLHVTTRQDYFRPPQAGRRIESLLSEGERRKDESNVCWADYHVCTGTEPKNNDTVCGF